MIQEDDVHVNMHNVSGSPNDTCKGFHPPEQKQHMEDWKRAQDSDVNIQMVKIY